MKSRAGGGALADEGQQELHRNRIYLTSKKDGREPEPVPVVEEYPYLGLLFRRDLSMEAMVGARLKRAEKALRCIRPFIGSSTVPLPIRVSVLQAVVMSSILYGS